MIAEQYKDDPNDADTFYSENQLCYDRSIYTHLEPNSSKFGFLTNFIIQAREAISPHLPTFNYMSGKDFVQSVKDVREAIMCFINTSLLGGRNKECSEVDVLIERRYTNRWETLVSWCNILGIAFLFTIVPSYFLSNWNITPLARRIAGLAHLAVAFIAFLNREIFLPRPTKSESGLPNYFPIAYSLTLSGCELFIALIDDWGESLVWLDAALGLLSLLLLWGLVSIMQSAEIKTDEAIVEIAERDYGAFAWTFFEAVQKEYKKITPKKCPINAKRGKLYVINGPSLRHKELVMKDEADYARSRWSEWWNPVTSTQ